MEFLAISLGSFDWLVPTLLFVSLRSRVALVSAEEDVAGFDW